MPNLSPEQEQQNREARSRAAQAKREAERNKIEVVKRWQELRKETKDVIDQINDPMREEDAPMETSNTAIPSAPPISNDPFDDEAAGNRMRLMITIAVLFALGGAVAYFLMRGFGG